MRDLRRKSKPYPSRLRGRGVEAALPLFYYLKKKPSSVFSLQLAESIIR